MTPHSDGLAWLKNVVKRFPRLYRATVYIFGGQPQNTSASAFVSRLPKEAKILNVGSGSRRLREGSINVDVIKFEGVDVVADAEALPFESNSVDAVVCDNVLEHTPRPDKIVDEIERVLKPGGLVYIAVPFVIPFHSSPNDYYRWSVPGLREMLQRFDEHELKIQYGPTAAFTMVLSEWLAILLSCNVRPLYTAVLLVATVVTAPLKLLDYLLSHYQGAENLALDLYFIGAKR
jgi:SAM-dependent methyltransferase